VGLGKNQQLLQNDLLTQALKDVQVAGCLQREVLEAVAQENISAGD